VHKSLTADIPLVSFPQGVPTCLNCHSMGRFVAARGYLPVTIFFEDWDIYWVRRGRGVFLLGTGHRFDVRPDDFVLLPPLVSAQVIETRPVLEFNFCHFDFRPVRRPASEWDGPDFRGPGPLSKVPMRFRVKDAPAVRKAYVRLIKAQKQIQSGKSESDQPWQLEQAVIGLISAVAAFGLKRHKGELIDSRAGRPNVSDPRIMRLLGRIDADPAKAWRVSELAKETGLSESHLHAVCIRVLGKSIKAHIIDARLRLAVRLLRPSPTGATLSMKQVARQAGFSSQHYFSRLFKIKYKIAPGQFQRVGEPI
jgi:AraC-like DNA-binding protein